MTTGHGATPPPGQQSGRNRRVTRELTAVLGAGVTGYGGALQVTGLLMQIIPAVPENLARFLATMASGGNLPGDLGVPGGPAQTIEERDAAAWLALYLVAAVLRLGEAATAGAAALEEAKLAEERFFELHLRAEERRMRAAALVDMASHLNTDREPRDLLGWRAVIDAKTTPECRAANGCNFRADRMPAIGWPGSVHRACRCSAGPPVPGAPLLPSI